MNHQRKEHDWTGQYAENFTQSVEKLVKYRYKPFAREIVEAIKFYNISNNPKILDVGSGPGILLLELKKINNNFQIIGVDFSETMIKIAESKAKENNLDKFEFRQCPAKHLSIHDNEVDVVVCLNSLHDFKDSHKAIGEIYRILCKGGIFVLKDKNGIYPKWKMRLEFLPLLFKTGFKRVLKYFRSNHLWLNPNTVVVWMEELGFKVMEQKNNRDYLIISKK